MKPTNEYMGLNPAGKVHTGQGNIENLVLEVTSSRGKDSLGELIKKK